MNSREEVLSNVRRALDRTGDPPATAAPVPILRTPAGNRDTYLQIFARSLENLAGHAIVVANPAAVIPAIAELLVGKRVVCSNAPFLESCGIAQMPGIQSKIADRESLKQACAQADVGISSADYVLAETGSFVMLSSREEARLVSLLPPTHIAVFPRSRILANLDELLTIIPNPAEQTSAMVLITGPSRTADIEQILVRGVHGPGEVYAVIVDDF